jgi:asparagine synthase (glutamine-hydrolysing)
MGGALEHRGPDAHATWCDENCGIALAHRRLAILDQSPAGLQPMISADGRYVISYNGEIYNHLQIRRELEAAGSAPEWRGNSDTETMLASFTRWGIEGSLQRFVGMFAFALWDREHRCLYLCRDRAGEKPLYYGWLKNAFVFGSELKALRQHFAWDGQIDRGALALFMRHSYISAPHCIFKDVAKLPQGSILKLEFGKSAPRIWPYWSAKDVIERGVSTRRAENPVDAINRLERLLQEAVSGQMLSDVPLGAFLSGGIDSSLVVALMQAASSRRVQTFTIGFIEEAYNEAQHAKAIAQYLGTEHTELYVTPGQVLDVIPQLPTLYDEPFADSSQLPTFLVAQLARRRVTVALSGDGGDELFAGYERYAKAQSLLRRQVSVPKPIRSLLARIIKARTAADWDRTLGAVRSSAFARGRVSGDKLHRVAALLRADRSQLYRYLVSYLSDPTALVLGSSEPDTVFTDPAQQCDLEDFSQLMMAIDLTSYLPDDILVKVDRAAMAVSLETRTPMLDHRVIEYAWSLPQCFKERNGQSKWILRQILDKYVPRELVDRPKMGFAVPVVEWLRGPLLQWAQDLLSGTKLRQQGFLNEAIVSEKWRMHMNGDTRSGHVIWNILVFQAWLDEMSNSRSLELDSSYGKASHGVMQ